MRQAIIFIAIGALVLAWNNRDNVKTLEDSPGTAPRVKIGGVSRVQPQKEEPYYYFPDTSCAAGKVWTGIDEEDGIACLAVIDADSPHNIYFPTGTITGIYPVMNDCASWRNLRTMESR